MREYMKRLGVFLYNNKNPVDDYIQYLLDDITPNLSHLCVIMENNMNNKDLFKKYSEDIFINNDKKSMDIWKEVIVNYIGFDQLINYDEVILFDDSFFGPIYPFKEIFHNINNVNLDFWTIMSNGIDNDFNKGNLQFIAFRNKLIKSKEFKEFWLNIKNKSFKNKNSENYLINYFSKLGFEWENYLDVINNCESNESNSYFSIFDLNNFIIDCESPLISIKPFTLPKKTHLKYHNGLDLSSTMDYLNQNTNYDVSLIYNHLLKIMDPNALVNLLNLKKIIPKKNLNSDYKSNKSIAVIAHLYYVDLLDYDFKYLRNIPDYIDIIITTDDIDKKVLIENSYLSKLNNKSRVILVNSRGRDMSGLFVGCKDIIKNYDYFCFVHDKKSGFNEYYLTGFSFRDILWENTLASKDYINSIIKNFDDNDSLGLIVPPRIHHSTYFKAFYYNYWLSNVNEINKLFDEMNIDAKLNLKELPLPIGNCFWAKYDALKPLFDLNLDYEDFDPEPMPHDGTISHALERIYGHVAASKGFYTEIFMTDEYGSNEITNYPYMLSDLLSVIINKFVDKKVLYYSFEEFLNKFKKDLNKLDKNIRKKDKELNELKNSTSWKITKPLRIISFKFKSFKNKLLK